MWIQHGFFDHQNYIKKIRGNNVDYSTINNYIEKSMWKQGGYLNQQNYIEKSTWKQRGYFDQQNYIKKVLRNDVEICRSLVLHVST